MRKGYANIHTAHWINGVKVYDTTEDLTEMNEDPLHTPGAWWAKRSGCKCPRLDNFEGWGIWKEGKVTWIVNSECPIHGANKSIWENPDAALELAD